MASGKQLGYRTLGVCGVVGVCYALYSLITGEMYFPNRYGGVHSLTGWGLVYRATGLIVLGSYASTFLFHNGFTYTNRTVYKASKYLMVAVVLYGLVAAVVVTTVFIQTLD